MIKISLFALIISMFSVVEVISQNTSGHMRFELIKIVVIDSAEFDEESVKLYSEFIKSNFEYDTYFSPNKLVEVRKKGSDDVIFKTIFDKTAMVHTQYLSTSDGKYFSIDSLNSMTQNSELASKRDVLKDIPTIEGTLSENKNIFGFDCQKISVMNPSDNESKLSTLFTTKQIPTPESDAGRFSFMSFGYPLEIIINMDGIELHVGIVEYEIIDEDHKVFIENNEEYELMELQELLLRAER